MHVLVGQAPRIFVYANSDWCNGPRQGILLVERILVVQGLSIQVDLIFGPAIVSEDVLELVGHLREPVDEMRKRCVDCLSHVDAAVKHSGVHYFVVNRRDNKGDALVSRSRIRIDDVKGI